MPHDFLALFFCARIREIDRLKGQPDRVCLSFKQLQSRGVHRDTVVFLVHNGKQTDKFDPWVLLEQVKCPRAVFAGTPTQ